MKKIILLCSAFVLFCSHDMFLKMDSFFVEPESLISLNLYNGTFEKSENIITRDRMQDVSIVGGGNQQYPADSMWTEKDNITVLNFKTGNSGTYVAGVSTYARDIELSAQDFNDYLKHDGVVDMIDFREENGQMEDPAVEKYSKHVKAIFQVGENKTSDWKKSLGYPIEFIPQSNPYNLTIGQSLKVQLLRDGEPLSDQLVYSGFVDDSHGHDHNSAHDEDEEHEHLQSNQVRTDYNGFLNIEINHRGHWYIRTIHMVTSNEEGLTHESNWATLTFEVMDETHHHFSIPSWLLIAGGAIVLFGLYYLIRR